MRVSTIVMIGFAVLFGLLAVFVAQSWLNSQAEQRMKSLEAQKKPIATATIVVAGKPLRYRQRAVFDVAQGNAVARTSALPAGAFDKITELTATRRVVLTAIETNEPILSSKITGPGQRATLSATLQNGMKAVTIRVNDVEGVGGFVLPGDRVDVALTRQMDKGVGDDRRRVAERARARHRPERRRAHRQAADRKGRHARSRYRSPAQKLALAAIGRNTVADAAQGRRGRSGYLAARHALGSRQRRQHRRTPASPPSRCDGRRSRDDYSVPTEDGASTVGAAERRRVEAR